MYEEYTEASDRNLLFLNNKKYSMIFKPSVAHRGPGIKLISFCELIDIFEEQQSCTIFLIL